METFPEDEENRATTTAIERSKRSNRSTEKRLSGTSLLNEHGGDSEGGVLGQEGQYAKQTAIGTVIRSNKPFCLIAGCLKLDMGRGYCVAHGGGRRCKTAGCTKSDQGGGFCISHGGGRRCSKEGCSKLSQGGKSFCKAHGGGRRCQKEGCRKLDQGGGFCKGHGGGRRCTVANCTKGDQGGGLCKGHGGGKRCEVEGCPKSDQGGGFCIAHGGGRRRAKMLKKEQQQMARTGVLLGADLAADPQPAVNGAAARRTNPLSIGRGIGSAFSPGPGLNPSPAEGKDEVRGAGAGTEVVKREKEATKGRTSKYPTSSSARAARNQQQRQLVVKVEHFPLGSLGRAQAATGAISSLSTFANGTSDSANDGPDNDSALLRGGSSTPDVAAAEMLMMIGEHGGAERRTEKMT